VMGLLGTQEVEGREGDIEYAEPEQPPTISEKFCPDPVLAAIARAGFEVPSRGTEGNKFYGNETHMFTLQEKRDGKAGGSGVSGLNIRVSIVCGSPALARFRAWANQNWNSDQLQAYEAAACAEKKAMRSQWAKDRAMVAPSPRHAKPRSDFRPLCLYSAAHATPKQFHPLLYCASHNISVMICLMSLLLMWTLFLD
jgi:hypothetical protein